MQTNFDVALLTDRHMRSSEKILRSCVHCGFCTATCPTYLLLGDELDSPRGRIYLIKDMLEHQRPPSAEVVTHIDRCLSCLSCMTTCPSGVNYMHLVDHARAYIEATYKRPLADRVLRALLSRVLPSRRMFRASLGLARIAMPFRALIASIPVIGGKLAAMLALVPVRPPVSSNVCRPQSLAPIEFAGAPRRVALLNGCAQAVLAPDINAAAVRLLNRAGIQVVYPKGEGCCGSLVHHMGLAERALDQARANIDAWSHEMENGGLEAILSTASGCGTTLKDYAFMFRDDVRYAEKAKQVSALARDVTEFLDGLNLTFHTPQKLVVAYHSACSMQHGQKVDAEPKNLLRRAGFVLRNVPEGHICCGSAGTYNILQPDIAEQLRKRKVQNIERMKPDVIATGNIGCITQIGIGTPIPIVHTAELLDWCSGGPPPKGIRQTGTLPALGIAGGDVAR